MALLATAQITAHAETDAELGIKEFNTKNYRGALAHFRQQLTKSPRDVSSNYYAGLCYQYLGNNANALAMYKRVQVLAPDSAMAKNCEPIISKLAIQNSRNDQPVLKPTESTQQNQSSSRSSNETDDPLSRSFSTCARTERFTVYSNSSESYSAARFLSCFVDFISANYCKVNSNFHRNAFIFDNEAAYHSYSALNFKSQEGAFAIYVPKRKAFFTYSNSGIGTWAHEMIHAVIDEEQINLEPWADEGIAAIFEKTYGYCDDERPNFIVGYPNPWRIEALGQGLTKLSLEKLVTEQNSETYNTSEKREVAMFLFKHGQLKNYIDLCRTQNKRGFNTYFEAALQRRIPELNSDWYTFLKTEQAQSSKIKEIPSSSFFESKARFDQFLKSSGRILANFK